MMNIVKKVINIDERDQNGWKLEISSKIIIISQISRVKKMWQSGDDGQKSSEEFVFGVTILEKMKNGKS